MEHGSRGSPALTILTALVSRLQASGRATVSIPAQRGDRAPERASGPSPANAVRAEVLRALWDGVLLAPRVLGYAASRRRLAAEVRADLDRPAHVDPVPTVTIPRDRPLAIFVACAEVSGEIHAVNFVRAMQRRIADAGAPPPRLCGLGGDRLASAGVELLGRPVDRAQMGFQGIASSLPYYTGLLRDAAAHVREVRPDVVCAVDSPALHVPLLRIAHRYDVRTLHFVTPQYWGWAPWRVNSYKKGVDRALSILPFERAWFERRGVSVAHVGHPLLDELAHVPQTTPREDARELVILPGSRSRVIERNLPWMLAAAERLRARVGDVPVVVAHERSEIAEEIRAHIERAGAASWARLETGDLHAILARARAALSVSGTVLLDLLHHDLPTVVLYRLAHAREVWLKDRLLTVPWFSSINLLAASEVYPEFAFHGDGPVERIGETLLRCYNDRAWRERCRAGLALARERLGPAGACDRAAAHALALACGAT